MQFIELTMTVVLSGRRHVLLSLGAIPFFGAIAFGGTCPGYYSHDDGESNNALGGINGDVCGIHRFEAAGGADLITRVLVTYGTTTGGPSTWPSEGTPVTVCIWSDPNGDGDPGDGQLLVSVGAAVENPGTDIFSEIVVPATAVTGTFFVGWFITISSQTHPISLDGDQASSGRAWICASATPGAFDPTDLSSNDLPPTDTDNLLPALLMIRAIGSAELVGSNYCFGDSSGEPCPCGNNAPIGSRQGCLNSTLIGATACGSGGASVGMDDLEITALGLLPNQPALLFVGENAINMGNGIAFGDGLRCAGTNVLRLGVRVPSAEGQATWGPGLRSMGGWTSGETRRFQVWYRDPTGSPCGTLFNLSTGLKVTFTP